MTEEYGDNGDDREYRLCRALESLEAEDAGHAIDVEDDDDVDWRTSVTGEDDDGSDRKSASSTDFTWLLVEIGMIQPAAIPEQEVACLSL